MKKLTKYEPEPEWKTNLKKIIKWATQKQMREIKQKLEAQDEEQQIEMIEKK